MALPGRRPHLLFDDVANGGRAGRTVGVEGCVLVDWGALKLISCFVCCRAVLCRVPKSQAGVGEQHCDSDTGAVMHHFAKLHRVRPLKTRERFIHA